MKKLSWVQQANEYIINMDELLTVTDENKFY